MADPPGEKAGLAGGRSGRSPAFPKPCFRNLKDSPAAENEPARESFRPDGQGFTFFKVAAPSILFRAGGDRVNSQSVISCFIEFQEIEPRIETNIEGSGFGLGGWQERTKGHPVDQESTGPALKSVFDRKRCFDGGSSPEDEAGRRPEGDKGVVFDLKSPPDVGSPGSGMDYGLVFYPNECPRQIPRWCPRAAAGRSQ